MAKYAYPAVFTPEENGRFSVNFPDLESCYTCGDDMKDALIMAEDALAFTLYDYEREGQFLNRQYKTISHWKERNLLITLHVIHLNIASSITTGL